jgi:hypothetical protein
MLFIMYRKYKAHRSSLIKAFYRDGIGYFVVLSGRFLTLLGSKYLERSKMCAEGIVNIITSDFAF